MLALVVVGACSSKASPPPAEPKPGDTSAAPHVKVMKFGTDGVEDHAVAIGETIELHVNWGEMCGNFPCKCQDFELDSRCDQPCKIGVMDSPDKMTMLDGSVDQKHGKFHCDAFLKLVPTAEGAHRVSFTLKHLPDGALRPLVVDLTVSKSKK